MDRRRKKFYDTWQEASKAAIGLGLLTQSMYDNGHHKDPKLPGSLQREYNNFPGWRKFRGHTTGICKRENNGSGKPKKKIYKTWKLASKAAKRLKLTTPKEYRKGYKSDACLHSTPKAVYSDFPGWKKFLK